jgi:predicted carbohydrate-binding protein with CBM5 and CBM33 domain
MRSYEPSHPGGRSRAAVRRSLAAVAVLLAAMAAMLTWANAAHAHGTIVDPPTRAYHCRDAWGADHMNPAMQQEDPMCWQAFQANPDTMWNWMSALRNGLAGNFQGATPDGKLCSNNISNYDSLNKPGAWKTTNISNNFTMHLYDQASHGADYFRVYVSKNGYDPTTQSLGWGNLDFITETGRYAPATDITFNVSTSGYTGRHIVFTIWQASHQDQTYMWCSDVNFGGSSPSTPASPSTSPSRSPSVSPSASASASRSSGTPTGAGCRVTYTLNDWGGGFTGAVTVTNTGASPINGWKLQWTFGGNQTISSAWNGTVTQSGQAVTATNASYNATIAAGGNAQFGFQGTYSGTNSVPAQFTLNGTVCTKA